MAAFTAFNSWLDEDWGYAYKERLFAAPVPVPDGPRRGGGGARPGRRARARVICLRPGPVHTAAGPRRRSPRSSTRSGRGGEAGITAAFHGGDSGYGAHVVAWEPDTEAKAFFATPLSRAITSNRAISETMLAMLCHRMLERHPRPDRVH